MSVNRAHRRSHHGTLQLQAPTHRAAHCVLWRAVSIRIERRVRRYRSAQSTPSRPRNSQPADEAHSSRIGHQALHLSICTKLKIVDRRKSVAPQRNRLHLRADAFLGRRPIPAAILHRSVRLSQLQTPKERPTGELACQGKSLALGPNRSRPNQRSTPLAHQFFERRSVFRAWR